jgi:hypothetical protein
MFFSVMLMLSRTMHPSYMLYPAASFAGSMGWPLGFTYVNSSSLVPSTGGVRSCRGVRSTDVHAVTATMTSCAILLVASVASGVIAIFGLKVIFGLRVNFIGRSFFGLLANFIGHSFFSLLVRPTQVIVKPPKL